MLYVLKKAKFTYFVLSLIFAGISFYSTAQTGEIKVDIRKIKEVLPIKQTNILLGKTLQTGDPNKFIITIGPWKKRVRFSQVQGTRFNEGNPFSPNAVRSYTVSFEGEFSNIVIYDTGTASYLCLFDTTEYITQFQALSSQQTNFEEDIIVCERGDRVVNKSEIVMVGLNSRKMMEPLAPNQKLLDWSMNPFKSSIVLLVEVDDENNQKAITTLEFDLNQISSINKADQL